MAVEHLSQGRIVPGPHPRGENAVVHGRDRTRSLRPRPRPIFDRDLWSRSPLPCRVGLSVNHRGHPRRITGDGTELVRRGGIQWQKRSSWSSPAWEKPSTRR